MTCLTVATVELTIQPDRTLPELVEAGSYPGRVDHLLTARNFPDFPDQVGRFELELFSPEREVGTTYIHQELMARRLLAAGLACMLTFGATYHISPVAEGGHRIWFPAASWFNRARVLRHIGSLGYDPARNRRDCLMMMDRDSWCTGDIIVGMRSL